MNEPIHIISLGAGVQSSTMALMASRGEITPMPKAAIFADTKCEPPEVYRWLNWLEKQLPFPVVRVVEQRGLLSQIVKSFKGKRIAFPPFFTESDSNDVGKLRRQCTREFKVSPIIKEIRSIVGLKKGQRGPKIPSVIQWIGISTNEIIRMKDSQIKWIKHRWPLVDIGMSRHDCLRWIERNSYPQPPRSACTFCPYHSDSEWLRLKQDPYSWRQIVAVDALIRNGTRGTKQKLFLHRSMKPITEIDFSPEDNGQANIFGEECEGMCGV